MRGNLKQWAQHPVKFYFDEMILFYTLIIPRIVNIYLSTSPTPVPSNLIL